MKTSTAFIAALLACLSVAAAEKPNIVYMLADDLGYGDVQCLNPQRGKIATPNIDRLASQGMTFTDAHSGSSVCTPTRYGVLTGRYAWRTRLQQGVLRFGAPLIDEDRLTVAGFLQQQGYHTAGLGKWHLGFKYEWPANEPDRSKVSILDVANVLPKGAKIIDGPITRGFDSYYWFKLYGRGKRPRTWAMIEDDVMTERIPEAALLPELTARGVQYIKEKGEKARAGGKPFFLYWAPPVPHFPIAPSKEWQGRSHLTPYCDYVMQLDWSVGELLNALDSAGVTENTLVIFTSDNGCSSHSADVAKLTGLGHFPSAQFRGYKADIWDGGHRIPFIARWPGMIKPGTQSDQLTCLTDLLATCADIVGAELPSNAAEDSFSILPVLTGEGACARTDIVHHSIYGKFAIRKGPWKLAFCPGSGGWSNPRDDVAARKGLPPIQLYNLAAGVGEKRNVKGQHGDVVRQLTTLLKQHVAEGRSTPGPKQQNDVAVDIFKKNK
jgi:arylsulfatase A-like enzyme